MDFRARTSVQRDFTFLSRLYSRLAARKAARDARDFVAWIAPQRHDRALDAACGPGTLARRLGRLVAEVHCLDLCPSMIEAARHAHRRGNARTLHVVGDVNHLPYPSGSFSLLTCAYSFANFHRPERVLAEFARVLTPRGRVAVAEVLAPEDSARSKYLNRLEALRGPLPTRILKHSEFIKLFEAAGLRVQDSRLGRRQQSFRDWLRLSPAAHHRPERARRLRRMLLDSMEGDRAGLHPRRRAADILFQHTTGWFLLRPRGRRFPR